VDERAQLILDFRFWVADASQQVTVECAEYSDSAHQKEFGHWRLVICYKKRRDLSTAAFVLFAIT
jgi:hypothetical protein